MSQQTMKLKRQDRMGTFYVLDGLNLTVDPKRKKLVAAGPLLVWGLAAGVPAGLLPGRVAAVVHLPTRLLVWWIAGVARWAAALPAGALGLLDVAALAALVMAVFALRPPERLELSADHDTLRRDVPPE